MMMPMMVFMITKLMMIMMTKMKMMISTILIIKKKIKVAFMKITMLTTTMKIDFDNDDSVQTFQLDEQRREDNWREYHNESPPKLPDVENRQSLDQPATVNTTPYKPHGLF